MEIQKMRLVAVQKLFGPDKVGLWRTLERKHTIKCEAASQVVCERELPRLFTWEVYHLMGFFYFSSCNCSFCCACGGLIVLLLLRGQHLKSRYECQIAVLVNRALVSFYLTTALQDRSEEHTSELQSRFDLVCRLLLEKKN